MTKTAPKIAYELSTERVRRAVERLLELAAAYESLTGTLALPADVGAAPSARPGDHAAHQRTFARVVALLEADSLRAEQEDRQEAVLDGPSAALRNRLRWYASRVKTAKQADEYARGRGQKPVVFPLIPTEGFGERPWLHVRRPVAEALYRDLLVDLQPIGVAVTPDSVRSAFKGVALENLFNKDDHVGMAKQILTSVVTPDEPLSPNTARKVPRRLEKRLGAAAQESRALARAIYALSVVGLRHALADDDVERALPLPTRGIRRRRA